jgi:hypothetical protein
MDAIVLSAEVGEDRRLVIDLPPNTPTGRVDVVIKHHEGVQAPITNPAREAARAKLLAAGFLVTGIQAPAGIAPLSVEERLRLGTLPPDVSVDDIIDQDRGTC